MKIIWGLFPSYRDALGALDDFRRQGYADEDMSAMVQPSALRAPAPGPGRKGKPPHGSQGVSGGRKAKGAPPGAGNQGAQAGQPPAQRGDAVAAPPPQLPGSETFRLPGLAPLQASGMLAGALADRTAGQTLPQARAGSKEGLKEALAGLGLPAGYAELYADGVLGGQALVVARVADPRERDAVNTMRRHRAGSVAGLIAQEPNDPG